VLLVGVAGRARPGIERGRRVRAVAVGAFLVGMRADRGVLALRVGVAAHAVVWRDGAAPRGILIRHRAETGAVLALPGGRRAQWIGGMQRRAHRRVTCGADLERRWLEPVVAVAVVAGDAARDDVRDVTGAVANVAPGRRDMLRRRVALPGTGARDDPHRR